MTHRPSIRWATTVLALLSSLMTGCAISTPFPRGMAHAAAGQGEVVLVLTRVVVDTGQRAEFDRQTARVIASMPSQPGLLGFSARRQLFGNTGWTMSVWANDDARARFVQTAVHQEAIAKSLPAVVTVELKRMTVARQDIPKDWAQAIALLDEPTGRRNYGSGYGN